MTWCNDCDEGSSTPVIHQRSKQNQKKSCPSCGHSIQCQEQAGIHDLPGLPAGVKFDPTDQELLEHLEGKVRSDIHKLHPLIDEFIPTIEGEDGICYTHPEKLPGVGKDGLIRHFFHRPSKAYTTGTRKRRKVQTEEDGSETRWHKTGKTRPVLVGGKLKGYKKILVLYTNYGKQRKPEKTNWVMHQYHLGNKEEEKDGELVVSKVFYQTQPRQCNTSTSGGKDGRNGRHSTSTSPSPNPNPNPNLNLKNNDIVEFYSPSLISGSYDQAGRINRASPNHLISNFVVHADPASSFLP